MTRPTDWSPLAERDPLPGDPAAIEQEATRLRDFAVEVRDQVTRLRKVASDNEADSVGAYSVPLREACSELAGRLEKVVGRYEQVSGHLRGWAPDLRHAQEKSVEALNKAKEADPTGATMTQETPGVLGGQGAYRAAHNDAGDATADAVRAARTQLADAVDYAATRGRHWAGRIRESIEDDVRDGFWDNVKDFVDRNAAWIKGVSDALSVVATAAAVIAIVVAVAFGSVIPGVNVLLWTAMGAALAGHGLLALSGNEKGSWADVGLDVFALLTFGAGRIVTGGLKSASVAARVAGARAANRAATDAALRSTYAARRAAYGRLINAQSSAATRRVAREYLDDAYRQANRAGVRAARQVADEPIPTVRGLRAYKAGDPDASSFAQHAQGIGRRFPNDAAVQDAVSGVGWRTKVGLGAFAGGTAVDGADKGATRYGGEDYQRMKGYFRKEVGSTW